MADIVYLHEQNELLNDRLNDLKQMLTERRFASWCIVAIDDDSGNVISSYVTGNHMFALLGGIEAIKRDILDEID